MSRMLFEESEHPKLLPFQWLGVGTGEVESPLSAFRRVAFLHRVRPGTLYGSFFENACEGISRKHRAAFTSKRSFTWPDDEVFMRAMGQQMAELTGEGSAVFTSIGSLTALISHLHLSHAEWHFCPQCLQSEGSMYGRAAWEFRAVTACPFHGTRLVTPRCGAAPEERISGYAAISLCGLCIQCGAVSMSCQVGTPLPATREEVWASQQIGDLFAYVSNGGLVGASTLRRGIGESMRAFNPGSRRDSEAGVHYWYAEKWRDGAVKPSLQGLLALASFSGVTLVDLFTGAVGKRGRPHEIRYECKSAPGEAVNLLPTIPDRQHAMACLDALVQEKGVEDVTEEDVAVRLGMPLRILKKFRSDVCCELFKRRQAYFRALDKERVASLARANGKVTINSLSSLLGIDTRTVLRRYPELCEGRRRRRQDVQR